MRIIANSSGDYVQVLEEFTANNPLYQLPVGSYGGDWLVALHNSQVMVLHMKVQYPQRMWNKEEFIEYKNGLVEAHWRNQVLKEKRLSMFNDILSSVIRFERELKIDRVLRDESEYQYCVC